VLSIDTVDKLMASEWPKGAIDPSPGVWLTGNQTNHNTESGV